MFLIFLILGGPDPKIEGGPGPPWPPPYYPPELDTHMYVGCGVSLELY